MNSVIRNLIWDRAEYRCEYCHIHQDDEYYTLQIEHIIAKQHGGSDRDLNLCLSCRSCNLAKGPNVAGVYNDKIVPLFNPRRQNWNRHFTWNGPILVGKTLAGIVTVQVLSVNHKQRIALRTELIASGTFPPSGDDTLV